MNTADPKNIRVKKWRVVLVAFGWSLFVFWMGIVFLFGDWAIEPNDPWVSAISERHNK